MGSNQLLHFISVKQNPRIAKALFVMRLIDIAQPIIKIIGCIWR